MTNEIAGSGSSAIPISELKCSCGYVGLTPRGFAIHKGKCPQARAMKRDAGKPAKAPVTLGHTPIEDPASKQIDVIQGIAETVRKTRIKSLKIKHTGDDWHVDAFWSERS